jgi:Rod binding domain-containing protein
MTTPSSSYSLGTPGASLHASTEGITNLSGKPDAEARMQKLTKVAKQFEGVLLSTLLQEVQKGTLDPSEAGLGAGSDTLRSLGTEAVAEAIAQKGGLGIARMIVNHFRYLAEDGS